MKRNRKITDILSTKGMWYSRLYNVFINAFSFNDMPYDEELYRDCDRYLKNNLFFMGNSALFKNEYGAAEGGTVSGIGGLTWCNSYDKYEIVNTVRSVTRDYKDIAICYNTASKRPFCDIVDYYASILEEIEKTMQINVRAQNTPPILRSPRGEELSYAKAYEEIAGYKPVVLGGINLLDTSGNQLVYQTPAQYVADSLEMLKHDILNDYFSIFGATSKSVEKRTVVLKAEVSSDMDSKELSIYSFLDEFEYFIKKVNKIFGCNASVTINSKFVESQLEAYEQEVDFIKDGYTPEGEKVYDEKVSNGNLSV